MPIRPFAQEALGKDGGVVVGFQKELYFLELVF
jgi:hypothetical protein